MLTKEFSVIGDKSYPELLRITFQDLERGSREIIFQKKIVENEFVVRRLADISIDLFAIACVLSRASQEKDQKKDVLPSAQLARVFVRKARRRIAENIRRMAKNDDELEVSIVNRLKQNGDFPATSLFL